MSRYDAEYLRYYTGIDPVLLTSFSGYYTKGYPYNPTKEEFLTVAHEDGHILFTPAVIKTLQPGVNFINVLRTNFSYERHFGSFF